MKPFYLQHAGKFPVSLQTLLSRHGKQSPEEASRLISQGAVWNWTLRQRIMDPETGVAAGTLIRIFFGGPRKPAYRLQTRQIIYEDEHLLCLFKPAGVPCQSTPQSVIHSLDHGAAEYLKSLNPSFVPSVIHRLDTLAEGLVWFAKSREAEKALYAVFSGRRIKKYYLAAVPENSGFSTRAILKSPLEHEGKTQEAETRVLKLKTQEGYDFFGISLKTGRFHQIRKHFQKHLSPLAGDREYGSTHKGPLRLLCAGYRMRHPVTGAFLQVFYWPEGFFSRNLESCTGLKRSGLGKKAPGIEPGLKG